MATVALVFLIGFALAAIVVGYGVWRFVHSNDEPVAAGSYGRQFLGRSEKPQKPEDWLKK